MEDRSSRKGGYVINSEYEKVLELFNERLSSLDEDLFIEEGELAPLVLVCFVPRSGSTLLTQFMSYTGGFNYFSGFNARFWKAPVFSQIFESQLGLRSELSNIDVSSFKSNFGYTNINSFPHEFGFFWNQFLTGENHSIDSSMLSQEQKSKLVRVINSCRRVSKKPFFIKNGITAYNAKLFLELFPEIKFIHITRERKSTVQSIYNARKKLYGDHKKWWSLVPNNHKEIIQKSSSPLEEIVLQCRAIEKRFELILNPHNSLTINYSNLCCNPQNEVSRIFSFLGIHDQKIKDLTKFEPQNQITLSKPEQRELTLLMKKYF